MDLLPAFLDEGPPRVLHVVGEVDLATVDQFRKEIEGATGDGSTALVDLGEVTFIDAGGLRAILQIARARNGGGPLVLLNAARVERLFKVVGMSDLRCVEFRDGK
jgi:anti-anti-sigma factor